MCIEGSLRAEHVAHIRSWGPHVILHSTTYTVMEKDPRHRGPCLAQTPTLSGP
jgi:hypothetical protein